MRRALDQFDSSKFKQYLNEGNPSNKEILDILDSTLSRPEVIIIRGQKKRDKRNIFLNELLDIAFYMDDEVYNFVTLKFNLITTTEKLFDKITVFIDECEISKLKTKTQIWSHIERVESDYQEIKSHVVKHIEKKPKYKIMSPKIVVDNNEGTSYSPDLAVENMIKYLSLTLGLLGHKYKLFDNDKIILPCRTAVSDDDIFKAGALNSLALSWHNLEENSLRCILFGGAIYCNEDDDVYQNAKDNGIKTSYHFMRDESEYEIFDAISCERVRKSALQSLISIHSKSYIKHRIQPCLEKVGKLNEHNFLSEDELLTCITLRDIFCIDLLNDTNEYNNLTLCDWIRGYSTLRYLSQKIDNNELSSIISHQDLLFSFTSAGLANNKALHFIEIVSFGKGSKDLFDCPLIKLADETLYIAYFGLINPNISNIIMSRFSSLDIDISNKGYGFEDEVNGLISKYLSKSKTFKFTRENKVYEYDSVFVLDKRIFIFECKNRSLSWSSPVKAYRNKNYLCETQKQVIRLRDALIYYPEIAKEHFNINISDYEVIPVIFNCMPFSWKGKYGDVYVSDNSSFSRFVKSSHISLFESSDKMGVQHHYSKIKQWSGNKPNSDDLLRHLEDPIQLKPYLNSRLQTPNWFIANNEVAFTTLSYDVDTIKYAKDEKKLLDPMPPFKGTNKKKIKRSLKKKSRKNNKQRK